MRNIYFYFSILIFSVLFGCERKEFEEETKPQGDFVISVSTGNSDTRVSVDGLTVKWKEGDQIKLYEIGGEGKFNKELLFEIDASSISEDGKNANFTGMALSAGKSYVAVYGNSRLNASTGVVEFNTFILSGNTGYDYSLDYGIFMKSNIITINQPEIPNFKMRHLSSIIEFKVKLSSEFKTQHTLKKVSISSGVDCFLTFPNLNTLGEFSSGNAVKMISKEIKQYDMPLLSKDNEIIVAIPVLWNPAINAISGNFKITVHDTNGMESSVNKPAKVLVAGSNYKSQIVLAGEFEDKVAKIINAVKWTTCNVDAPGTFAASPESFGMFYQWNCKIGWSSTAPITSSPSGHSWDKSWHSSSTTWESPNDPCPVGWRVPTRSEIESLIKGGSIRTTKNGVKGFQFGSGSNTLFLPAAGYRSGVLSTISGSNLSGEYWSCTPNYNALDYVFGLSFNEKNSPNTSAYFRHNDGYCLRCVAEESIPVTSVSLDKTNLSLKVGTYQTITPTVLPDNATDKYVVWTSDNPSVATINNNTGSVYGVAPGTTTITAKAGDETATCEVTVSGISVFNVSLDKTNLLLKVGESYTLLPTIYPSNATNKTVTWKSSNPSVATVNVAGKVVAVSTGTTTITANASGAIALCGVTVGSGGGGEDGGDGGGGGTTSKTFNSAQLYYYGNMSSKTTYFRLSMYNYPSGGNDGLVIEGFCASAYTFANFKLDAGTYNFSSTYGVAKTFIEGEIFGTKFMGTYFYKPNSYIMFNGGTFTVSVSGNTYTVTTNFKGYSMSSFVENVSYKYVGVPQKINYLN